MGKKESFSHSTQKYRLFTFGGALLLLVLFIVYMHTWAPAPPSPAKPHEADSLSVQVIAMRVDSGWGYQIWINHHPFIYQNQIPAIPGHQVFQNREEALRVGECVASKILRHQSPTITVAELQQLGISEARP